MNDELLDKRGSEAVKENKVLEGEFLDKVHERERATGRELEVVADAERDMKLPLKVLYEQDKIDVGKLPIWYLQALGSMTIREYNEFVKSNSDKLNINEIAASDLLSGVIAKDAVAVARFWDLQKTLLKSKNVIQQINQMPSKILWMIYQTDYLRNKNRFADFQRRGVLASAMKNAMTEGGCNVRYPAL